MGKFGNESSFRAPVESPDTLITKQTAYLLDLISEGPIGGLVDGLKSIALDETPIMHESGGLLYQGVGYSERKGLPDSKPHQGIIGAARVVGVEQEVTNLIPRGEGPGSGAVSRQIVDDKVTHVVVALAVQGLFAQVTDDQARMGDTIPATVKYKITVKDSTGAEVASVEGQKHDKATSRAVWEHELTLKGKAPWTVTVAKISRDSMKSNVKTDLYWAHYVERVAYPLNYPHCATVLLTADARMTGGRIPRRMYRVKGRLIDVPSNYDPDKGTYTGIWDGTFKLAVTDNPAWIFRDLVVNDRYGLAHWLEGRTDTEALVDKWTLYSIAQFCDELVPDGRGGKQRRYTFNSQIMGAGSAREVIQSMVSCFHGLAYWSTGMVFARADRPREPVKILNQTNVIDGRMTYATGSYAERHTAALVTYNDQSEYGKPKIEYVRNPLSRPDDPPRELQITAYGASTPQQAYRHGLWALLSESEQLTCTCEVGLDCLDLLPGDVVAVADPVVSGGRWGGRAKAVNDKVLTLDAPLPNRPTKIHIMTAQGTVQTLPVTSWDRDKVTLASAPQPIVPYAVFVAEGDTISPKLFTVQELKEKDTGRFELSLRETDPQKFAKLEGSVPVYEPKPWRDVSAKVLPIVTGLRAVESTYISGGTAQNRVTLSWNAPGVEVSSFAVQVRHPNGTFDNLTTQTYSIDLNAAASGDYMFQVCCQQGDRRGEWSKLTFTAHGHGAKPKAPSGLKVTGGLRCLHITWAMEADPLVGYYEVLLGTTDEVSKATVVGRCLASHFDAVGLDVFRTYWVWLRAVDLSGHVYSDLLGPASATTEALKPDDIPPATISESHLVSSLAGALDDGSRALRHVEELSGEVIKLTLQSDQAHNHLAETLASVHETVSTAMTEGLSAEAAKRTKLEAKVGADRATMEQIMKTQIGVDRLEDAPKVAEALYTLKTDVNGHISGFGLANRGDKGSEFAVVADRFMVATANGGSKVEPVFNVDSRGVTLRGDLIAQGSVSGDKLNARTKISLSDGGQLVIGNGGYVQVGDNFVIDCTDGEPRLTSRDTRTRNGDYSVLTAGTLTTYRYFGNSYRPVKNLTHIESGVATSGRRVAIDGYWTDEPTIMLAPMMTPCYNPQWKDSAQVLSLRADDIKLDRTSGRCTFTPVAELTLQAGRATAEVVNYPVVNGYSAQRAIAELMLPEGTQRLTITTQHISQRFLEFYGGQDVLNQSKVAQIVSQVELVIGGKTYVIGAKNSNTVSDFVELKDGNWGDTRKAVIDLGSPVPKATKGIVQIRAVKEAPLRLNVAYDLPKVFLPIASEEVRWVPATGENGRGRYEYYRTYSDGLSATRGRVVSCIVDTKTKTEPIVGQVSWVAIG